MSMISVKITLAFIFIFPISQAFQQHCATSCWNEYCVADVQATDETLEAALKWACANGADCNATQPGGDCYEPDMKLIHHASYAFNSYYQKHKHINTASCYFKTAAVLTATEPTHGPCKFHLTC